jgi:hypothetical protein
MKNPPKRIFAFIFAGFFCVTVRAQNLDAIGVTVLRAVTTNLNGAGIRVAQAEAYNGDNGSTNSWEVNPANVAQPVALFTYTSGQGTSTSYPNSVGDWSSHADAVGNAFYGIPNGVATNVAHVDNYDANYFVQVAGVIVGPTTNYIVTLPATNIDDRVVNQSFIFGSVPDQVPVAEQQKIDSAYDNYAAQYNTLFVSGAGNNGPAGGSVCPPATCYNGMGVGAYGSSASSVGPTQDNGRAKPDITTAGLAGLTSFSTPFVSGAAAVLMQAGLHGDGGSDTNSAADIRTVKALLLNGAIKPADWTNNMPSPLDTRYGAGVLNAFNSYKQLAGGKHGYNFFTNIPTGTAHPPVVMTNSVAVLSGWDFNTNTSSSGNDGVNHYFLDVSNGASNTTFTATATLVWNRHQNKTSINNLNLFLYNYANSNLVVCSTSLVDNVEHIFVPKLAPGRYDLQVLKNGGTSVSASEAYALAWEFFSESLNVVKSGGTVSISWPVYPDGFVLKTATNLVPPVAWGANNPAPVVTNNQNVVLLGATNPAQFFRLQRP